MNLLLFLIFFPLVIAAALFFIKKNIIRAFVATSSALILAGASIFLLVKNYSIDVHYYLFESKLFESLIFITELFISGLIIYLGIKHKKPWLLILAIVQTILEVGFEFYYGHTLKIEYNLFLDKFSLVMALIIGIIGSLISVYAIGYMKDFHHHYKELSDKRNFFFFIVFLFISAMFGIVFANNLLWLFFFWEITTLCSFFLIGYKNSSEAINNAFRALTINMLGGVCFILGIVYLYYNFGVAELDKMLILSRWQVMIPVILLSMAGLTKSAQLPFSSWLLGAMVAPTPVSALLHSSTMVKAGVYLLIKLAPLLKTTMTGLMLALIGGGTFLMTSLIAISQSDAKKVLAYSTIANLGLIVMCAGVGTYEAVWAGILLIVFHAIAKCLLFLCVGTVEHPLGSRDIESMDALIVSMPRLAWMMLMGMAGMFLAPFGMLISKWAVLKALLDTNPVLSILLIYGSAATLFFWVKWMGKLLTVTQPKEILEKKNLESHIHRSEWIVLFTLAFLTIAVCLFFPLVSHSLIEPYVISIFGFATTMSKGNIHIMLIMMGMVILFPFSLPSKKTDANTRVVDPYLAGLNVPGNFSFHGSLGKTQDIVFKNYYMEKYFSEERLLKAGILAMSIFIVIMFLGAFL